MANLTRESWAGGWNPSMDEHNGDPSQLLRMDNLTLDDEGVLSLVKGTERVNQTPYGAPVANIYSYILGTEKVRYVHTLNGQITRTSDDVTVLINGNNTSAFGSAFGQVLMTSGQQFLKDDGILVRELGISPPHLPVGVAGNPRPRLPLDQQMQFWTLEEGTGSATGGTDGGFVLMTPTSTNQRAAAVRTFTPAVNTMALSGDKPENDVFQMSVRIGNTRVLDYVEIEFYMNPPALGLNYYKYTWRNVPDGPFVQGIDEWSTLKARRGDFERMGTSSDDWSTIFGARVTMVFNAPTAANANQTTISSNNLFQILEFVGGEKGKLVGYYDYTSVFVYNSGSYVGKSKAGPVTRSEYIDHGSNVITLVKPSADKQPNEIWIFRRSRLPEDSLREYLEIGILDRFYRVAVVKATVSPDPQVLPIFPDTVEDTMSDEDAIKLSITLNEYLEAVKHQGQPIIGMEGLYFERMLYLTPVSLLVSDRLNPDAIDTRFTIQISGDRSEKYLWVSKVTNGVLLLATTHEIYEIAGDFAELPDGVLNISVRPIGEKFPPISTQFCRAEGMVFYTGSDGPRFTRGSNSETLAHQLRFLFQGETRHEFPPVAILPSNNAIYPCAIADNHLWYCLPFENGERWMFVYDLVRKYWHPRKLDPFALFTEADGTLLGGFGGGSGNYLQILNTGDDLAGINGQDILFRTIWDDDNLPRNRKDVFTFKVVLDTGGDDVTISIAKAGTTAYTSLGTFNSSGKGERFVTIAETIGLTKSLSVKIQGLDMTKFKLYNFTIEYEPRPEQLTYIRIPYQNLGTQTRKRWVNFAFVIDTLGVECEFFPYIDGVQAGPSSVFSFDRKATYIHYFFPQNVQADEFTGTDIGGIICGFFEFYGVNLDETISEKLPVPVKFLLIPANDYGTPNRKRHSSYKFQINTRGRNVLFTPRVDHQWMAPVVYNTPEKQTVEYFFTVDTTGIDIGGTLHSLENTPFEFYGVITPQNVEVLPPRLREFWIPENNYGIFARKRIRTMPMEIFTGGQDVTFTPIVDGVRLTPSTFNTSRRQTVFHYFITDTFGVDYSGELISNTSTPFEFYGLLKPEDVETLPVAKRFDQIGPMRFDKLGIFQTIRIRAIFGDSIVPIKVITEMESTVPNQSASVGEWTHNLAVRPNCDDIYEISVPKTVNGTIFRIEIGPTLQPFHRYDLQAKMLTRGMEATPKWIKVA